MLVVVIFSHIKLGIGVDCFCKIWKSYRSSPAWATPAPCSPRNDSPPCFSLLLPVLVECT